MVKFMLKLILLKIVLSACVIFNPNVFQISEMIHKF